MAKRLHPPFNVLCRTCGKCRNTNPEHAYPLAAARRELRQCPTPSRCEFEYRAGGLDYAPVTGIDPRATQ